MLKTFDIHAHIHGSEYDADRDNVVSECLKQGIGIITVGTDYSESEKAVQSASLYENVWATVGIHPVDKVLSFEYEKLKHIASHQKVVAIGECGLDYYWPAHDGWKTGEKFEKERQKQLFERQIELAIELDLPLMIHGRPTKKSMDAYEDILNVLSSYQKKYGLKVRGNVHFFAGTLFIAQQFWDMGFTTSFTGVITFTHDYDDVVRSAPLSMLMAETDSPYATPVPYRGRRNESLYVEYVYTKIAQLKDVGLAEVKSAFRENIQRIFGV